MTLSLADEIREEFDRIRKRYEGVTDAIAPMRVSKLEKIEKHITKLEAEVNAPKPCAECGTHSNLFEIDHKRADAKPYELMTEAAIERMQARGVL